MVAPIYSYHICSLLAIFSIFSASLVATISDGQQNKRWNVVFVLGPPGAGKGTQCDRIAKEFGYVHVSVGDLLREERARNESELGALIEDHIRNGSIVPSEITCRLIDNAMSATRNPNGFLIDGFPRNQGNVDCWKSELEMKTNLQFVLFLDCDTNVCISRCLQRNQSRSDDNEESLRKRIVTYVKESQPIIDQYSELGLVRKVDANKSPDQVFEEIEKYFKEVMHD